MLRYNKDTCNILIPIINILLVIGFCFVLNVGHGQESLSRIHKEKADSLSQIGLWSEAYYNYKLSMSYSIADSNWGNWMSALKGICTNAVAINDAQLLLDSTSVFLKDIPEAAHNVKAALYENIGFSLIKLGNIYPGIINMEKAINEKKLFVDFSNSRHVESLMVSYYNLSNSYSNLGDQESALKLIDKAIELSSEIDHKNKCKYLATKGKYYFHNNENYRAVLQYLNAIDTCGESIPSYQFLAELYIEEDSLDMAKVYLDLSDKLIATSNEVNYYQEILKSDLAKKLGQLELAVKLRAQVFDNENSLFYQREETKEKIRYAQLLFEHEDYQMSMEIAQKALATFYVGLNESDILSRPIMESGLPDVWIIEALLLKADYFNLQYKSVGLNRDLEESKFYYDLLFQYFDELKSSFNSIGSQYRLGGYTRDIYSKVITFNLELFATTGNQVYFEKAFSMTQGANAFVLKNAVSERKAFELYNVPRDTIETYLTLKNLLNESRPDSLNDSETLLEFKALKNDLVLNYPGIKNYFKSHVIDLEAIQNNLKSNDLFVKFYMTDDLMFSFEISMEHFHVNKMVITGSLDSLVNEYNYLISSAGNWDQNRFVIASTELFDMTLKQILERKEFEDKSHLILVPDGPLKKISFNSLLTNDKIDHEIQASDYLINTYEISYLYYAGQLLNSENKSKDKNGFIGFGIEYQDAFLNEIVQDYQNNIRSNNNYRSIGLSTLKYAVQEVINSAGILDGDFLINEEVTLDNVLNKIIDFDIIHFSTHALVDAENYSSSYLVLSKNKSSEYQLNYSDIIKLNLNNAFVVLSACQTGTGTNVIGEGLMSLSRAFTHSGTRATMGAYWNASDKSTQEVMTLFYKNLKLGMQKSKALQQAQLEYLNNDNISSPVSRSPFYWSPWAIYGDNTPVVNESYFSEFGKSKYLILTFSICLLLGAFFLFKRNFRT